MFFNFPDTIRAELKKTEEHPEGKVATLLTEGATTTYRIDLSGEPSGIYAYLPLQADTAGTTGDGQQIGFSATLPEGCTMDVRVRQYYNAGDNYYELLQWTSVPATDLPQQYLIPVNKTAVAAGGKTVMEWRILSQGGDNFALHTTVDLHNPYLYRTELQPENRVVTICEEKDNYRFGFNGQEKDNEPKGLANSLDFNFRIYDSRLGRFLSRDPLVRKFPMLTPYQFGSNNPIWMVDLEGKEGVVYTVKMWTNSNGQTQQNVTTAYDVGGNSAGVLYQVTNLDNNSYSEMYIPDVVVRPTNFQNWLGLQKRAWRNGWEGKIGEEAVGKHVIPTFVNTLGLLIGATELKAAWQAKEVVRFGLAATDVAITTDNLLGGGNNETPLESQLSPNGKVGLNGLKTLFGIRGVANGLDDIRNVFNGKGKIEDLGINLFSTGAAANDVIENGGKTVDGFKQEKKEKSEKKGTWKSGQAIYGQ